jgi:nitrate reductase gamma subunit
MNSFLFVGLPYASVVVMLVGSIYVYLGRGYKVSSLSTQLLEGGVLSKGANLFHFGIAFLFFGHLCAFLFPFSVIAVDASQVRLLILEVSAFGFGLSALCGLSILIYRRLTNPRIRAVTSKADVVVFAILLVQIVSGLLVAYFNRWGSAWFSATLTPYLRSLLTLDPNTKAVDLMPLTVKLHVVSAFVLIGVIPFTRFMHFLVFPIGYLLRRPQVVIWNRDPRKRRASRSVLGDGVRSLNN